MTIDYKQIEMNESGMSKLGMNCDNKKMNIKQEAQRLLNEIEKLNNVDIDNLECLGVNEILEQIKILLQEIIKEEEE